jgi:hypothetical protein
MSGLGIRADLGCRPSGRSMPTAVVAVLCSPAKGSAGVEDPELTRDARLLVVIDETWT